MRHIVGTLLCPSNWLLGAAAVTAARGDVVGTLLCLGLALTLGAGALLTLGVKQRV
jgi:hypothetical protein